jgi:cold shock CspA family protein
VTGRPAIGRVTAFDDRNGLGEVTDADGNVNAFHCTQIADGTRTIAVGTEVEYEIVPAQLGRWEATGIRPRS